MDADLENLTTAARRADAPPDSLRTLARALLRAGRVEEARARLAACLAPGVLPAARAADYLAAVMALGEGLGDPRGAVAAGFRGTCFPHPDQRHLVTSGSQVTELWDLETGARLAAGPTWDAPTSGGFPGPSPTRLHHLRAHSEGFTLVARELSGESWQLADFPVEERARGLAMRQDAAAALVRVGFQAREIALPGGAMTEFPPPPEGSVGQAWIPVSGTPLQDGGWLIEWVEMPPTSLRRLRMGGIGSFRGAIAAALTHTPSGRAEHISAAAAPLAHSRQYRRRPAGVVRPDGAEFAHLVTVDNGDGRELRLFSLPELAVRDTIPLAGPRHDHEGGTRQIDSLPVYVEGGDILVQSGPWLARVDAETGAVEELPDPGFDPPQHLHPRSGGLVAIGPARVIPVDSQGHPTHPPLVHRRILTGLTSSLDGARLLTTDRAGEVACWDLRRGEHLWSRPMAAGLGHLADSPFDPDLNLGFSPEGSCALVWRQGQAMALDAATGERRRAWSSHPEGQWSAAALGPEGRTLVCSESHQGFHRLGPRGELEAVTDEDGYVSHLTYLAGGQLVASLGGLGLRIHDAGTLAQRQALAMPHDDLDLRIWPRLLADPRRARAYVVAATGEVLALEEGEAPEPEEAFDLVAEACDLAFAVAAPRAAIRPNEDSDLQVVDLADGRAARVRLPSGSDRAPFALSPEGDAVWVVTRTTVSRVPVPPLEPPEA